ncbi:uncharacterized protein [Epargyreus clarus]|uniref:uncharacterized protein n=1 Tax=Epargyreus clarus TaxID=520877 RepID=UPI003C2DEF92
MFTKVLVLALVSIVGSNDVIVGLKTDGTKFFDEVRQANPALWRQMENVTIKAPENEVISRVVITDLRPEKDGDVKIVEGGEGQKNVTIEIKSPTVFRGYEFHIEVYSSPEGQLPVDNNQQTTENVQGDVQNTQDNLNIPVTNSDATSKLPDMSTDKNVPAILTKDEEITDNEREGRNAKNEGISTEGTTEIISTTNSDVSTTPVTQTTEMAENRSESNSTPNQSEQQSTFAPIPLYKSFNVHPAIPAINGRDITNNKEDMNTQDEIRHARDTEAEEESTGKKLDLTPTKTHLFVSSTENDKEASTTEINTTTENTDNNKEDLNAPKVHTFDNRKFTSIVSSDVHHPDSVKDEKQRNVRDANEQTMYEATTETAETTTADNAETSTMSIEECVTTETGMNEHTDVNPQNSRDIEGTTKAPAYINSRQWNQFLNNPRVLSEDASVQHDHEQKSASDMEDQSTSSEKDTELVGNQHKSSPDHMKNKNPKISAIANFKEKM